MTTSAPNTGPKLSARAVDVHVDEDEFFVRLEDGRLVGVPIVWFPRLATATLEQRRNWKLIGRGVGIRWPDIDEDISVENLLATDGELRTFAGESEPPAPDEPPAPPPPKVGRVVSGPIQTPASRAHS